MIAVWESDISATFLIFRLKCSTDAAFFKIVVVVVPSRIVISSGNGNVKYTAEPMRP